jgi:hypothetical protein
VAQLLHALGQRCLICECLGLGRAAQPISLAAGGAELADLAGQITIAHRLKAGALPLTPASVLLRSALGGVSRERLTSPVWRIGLRRAGGFFLFASRYRWSWYGLGGKRRV